MKTFAEMARVLNIERKRARGDPRHSGFRINKRGLLQKSIPVSVFLLKDKQYTLLGNGVLCYADQDPSIDTTDAELLRVGVYEAEDVGSMWVYVNRNTYMLAKISPAGAEALIPGFLSENWEVYIEKGK